MFVGSVPSEHAPVLSAGRAHYSGLSGAGGFLLTAFRGCRCPVLGGHTGDLLGVGVVGSLGVWASSRMFQRLRLRKESDNADLCRSDCSLPPSLSFCLMLP